MSTGNCARKSGINYNAGCWQRPYDLSTKADSICQRCLSAGWLSTNDNTPVRSRMLESSCFVALLSCPFFLFCFPFPARFYLYNKFRVSKTTDSLSRLCIRLYREIANKFPQHSGFSRGLLLDLFRLSATRERISLWSLQDRGTMALQCYRIGP